MQTYRVHEYKQEGYKDTTLIDCRIQATNLTSAKRKASTIARHSYCRNTAWEKIRDNHYMKTGCIYKTLYRLNLILEEI